MDQLVSVHQNDDDSFDFAFIFDAGNGVTGETIITLPAAADDQPAYTLESAKAAVLPLAAAKKADWIVALGNAQVVGPVSL